MSVECHGENIEKIINELQKEIHQAEYFDLYYREISVDLLKAIVNLLICTSKGEQNGSCGFNGLCYKVCKS